MENTNFSIEQIYTGCLAQGAYYIESNGEVAIIDPLRETQQYVDKATKENAKIKSILNRKSNVYNNEQDTFEFEFGDFNFNSKLRILTHKDDESYKLSPKENQLLKMLVLNFDDLLPRDIALNKIWRDSNYFTSRSMDVYIAKLRKYLKNDDTVEILNIHGEGFRLVDKN